MLDSLEVAHKHNVVIISYHLRNSYPKSAVIITSNWYFLSELTEVLHTFFYFDSTAGLATIGKQERDNVFKAAVNR